MDMNKPVAWITPDNLKILENEYGEEVLVRNQDHYTYEIPLYTHPAKPAICVGYWDNKTGAFHKHLTESQQKRVDEGFLQPVYTAGMLPIRELTDEEMMKAEYEFLTWNRSLNNRLVEIAYELPVFQKVVAILRKAQEK